MFSLVRIIWHCFVWIFNRYQVLIERNFRIMHWYEINMNPACDALGGVFKSCVSFTLSPFESRSEDIPDFGNIISLILKEEQISVQDNARIIPSFLSCYHFWEIKLISEVFWLINSNIYDNGTVLGHMFERNVSKPTRLLKFYFFYHRKTFL